MTINRPWISSFSFETLPYAEKNFDQLHKLARNFVCSLDLGCPGAKHVQSHDGVSLAGLDERERYLVWVKAWKKIYNELSRIIRQLKQYRKTIQFPKMTTKQIESWARANHALTNLDRASHLRGLSERHMARLVETAQVLLNARYNAKLAAAESRRRLKAA